MSDCEAENVKADDQPAANTAGGQKESQNEILTAEELRKRRQAYFDR